MEEERSEGVVEDVEFVVDVDVEVVVDEDDEVVVDVDVEVVVEGCDMMRSASASAVMTSLSVLIEFSGDCVSIVDEDEEDDSDEVVSTGRGLESTIRALVIEEMCADVISVIGAGRKEFNHLIIIAVVRTTVDVLMK